MHITLRHLRIFEAVARHGSISRAAADLHLTQPAVSMQMKQLEEQIGLPLVEQIGRRMCLTEAGQLLRLHACDMADRMANLNASMAQFRDLERGLLRLAVVSTANYFLPALIADFNTCHPGVRISLQVGNRAFVLSALADNSTDLAIIGQPPDGADLVAQDFKDNPLVVIASPRHALAGQPGPVSMARLADEVLVVREPGSGTRAAAERQFAAHGLTVSAGCEFSTNEAIKQAVRAGLGLAVVSAQTIELELQTGCLAVLPVEGFPIVRQWYAVQRKQHRLSAAAATFRDMLLAPDPAGTPRPARKRAAKARASA
ncbi:MAG: LysR family transcriptional regulator [Aquabacterium sp.]|nr:LysR family transcriptional regulator [Aquabacterium sp.]